MPLPTIDLAGPTYRRDLGDGLVLRWSSLDDAEAVAAVVSDVFGAEGKPSEAERKLVLETFRPEYPHGGPTDWAVVEDTASRQLVAATALMSQTWSYDGIPLAVGRPEQVVTRAPYRRRGLIRAIFDLLHARSAARGQLMQVIDGIPYFYRQLGYEYALDVYGGPRVYWSAIDAGATKEAAEPYRLRDATPEDIPLLTRLYAREQADSLVSVVVGDDYWRWTLGGQDHTAEHGWRPLVIVDSHDGTPIGHVVLRDGYQWADANALAIPSLSVEQGVPLRAVMPSVLRALKRRLPTLSPRMTGDPPLRVLFVMGRHHPVYDALDQDLLSPGRRPYAWYVRVPDLAALVRHVAPALERRLAASHFAQQSLTQQVSFYRGMLTLRIQDGSLAEVDEQTDRRNMGPGETSGAGAGMPRDLFVQLLLGYRPIDPLRDAHPDVLASDESMDLLRVLFPKRMSRPLLVN
ncbi:MAG TPA: GNAT family N-acetyltransferase [Chloroflexota bacterium]|nr:GNAT family N-acetyltransferase [Chloroflexota bacterium]